jgi:hypothetical protein
VETVAGDNPTDVAEEVVQIDGTLRPGPTHTGT